MAMKRKSRSKMRSMKDSITKGGIGKKIFPIVKTVSAPISFLEQITAHDRKNLGSSFSGAGYGTQLKIMTNLVMGRMAGVTPFHGGLPTAKQTINLSGVSNKWTTSALAGIGYQLIGGQINKMTGKNYIPETAKIGSISKSLFIGGLLGGVFSPSEPKAVSPSMSFPTNTVTSYSNTNGTFNSGSDSTGSSY